MGGPSLAELDQIAQPILSADKSLYLGVSRTLGAEVAWIDVYFYCGEAVYGSDFYRYAVLWDSVDAVWCIL